VAFLIASKDFCDLINISINKGSLPIEHILITSSFNSIKASNNSGAADISLAFALFSSKIVSASIPFVE